MNRVLPNIAVYTTIDNLLHILQNIEGVTPRTVHIFHRHSGLNFVDDQLYGIFMDVWLGSRDRISHPLSAARIFCFTIYAEEDILVFIKLKL